MTISKLDPSCFANVDLDIHSKSDLQPLVDGLGDEVIDLFVGRVRRTYEAHLELASGNNQTPTSIILGFCKIIRALPRSKRKIWDSAKSRNFDIGIHAPVRNHHYWSAVSTEAVRAAAELNAQIAVTVYGPMRLTRPKASRKANASQ
jgi:hypothetical protein